MTDWWNPPEQIARLGSVQRAVFCLACAERLLPSYRVQLSLHPTSAVQGWEDPDLILNCLDEMWAWFEEEREPIPVCVTEEDAETSENVTAEGMSFLVADTFAVVWFAYQSAASADQNAPLYAARRVFDSIDAIIHWPEVSYGASSVLESHPVVETERAEQRAVVDGLLSGVSHVELKSQSRGLGIPLAKVVAQLLREK